MIGLIKKDLLVIKSNLKTTAFILIIFLLMTLKNQSDFSFFPIFLVIMLAISTFSYDEYNNWNSYAITLPGGRTNIIRAKYITALILVLLSALVVCTITTISVFTNNNFELNNFLSEIFLIILIVTIIISITYPIIFKLGIEKGRITVFALIFLISTIIGLLLKNTNISIPKNITTFFNNYHLIIFPVLAVLIFLSSYKISKRVYLYKEF